MLQRAISFIKENLSVITIAPLIIGGMWQVLSLASMSPSYIRFFSVTQQIPDGIVVVFILSLLYMEFALSRYLFLPKNGSSDWSKVSDKNLLLRIILSFLWIAGVGIVVYITHSLFVNPDYKLQFGYYWASFGYVTILFFAALNLLTMIVSYSKRENSILKSNKLLNSKLVSSLVLFFLKISIIIIPIFLIFLFFNSAFNLHEILTVPYNLKNTSIIINKYCKVNGSINRDSVKLIYMNDKYIFIKDSSKIEVVKFDYMFAE